MNKKLLTIAVILIIICSATLIEQVSSATAEPNTLKIYIGPTSVPADNGIYNCVFVQLQDASGKPSRARQDTTISLSSSVTNIGTVDSSMTIQRGSTYGSANFYSTFTPGSTFIAAAASGYATVQASVTTVGPKASAVAVFGFPPLLPADGGSYEAVMVQLQDSTGSPAKAPKGGIQIALSCSNIEIGDVDTSVSIAEGQTYTKATFTTTTTAGQAVITPVTSDYTAKTGTITTKTSSLSPTQIKVYTGPTKVIADSSAYKQIAIELQDTAGNPAIAASDITVTLASSDQSIGTLETQLVIPQSKTYALATLTSTYKPGTTTITAAATDLTAASQTISTTGFIPSKLSVYCVPSTLPSDGVGYQAIQVQLQDSQGRPARDPQADVTVSLFSSEPTVGDVSGTLTIPFGKSHATGTLTVTNAPGTTSITAQASGYTTGQASTTTTTIDFSSLVITVTANSTSVLNGNKTEITVYINVQGDPITGAKVTFTSNNGGTFTTTTAGEAGYYKTTFTAPSFSKSTSCTITASGSKTGYIEAQGTTQITVGPNSTENSTVTNRFTLQLRVQDAEGNFISDANVSSTSQPGGVQVLSGSTNETGYVIFKNVMAGNYTFAINKEGYETVNQKIALKDRSLSMSLTMFGGTAQADNTWLIITVVVIVAIVSAVISLVLINRRKASKYPEEIDISKFLSS